MVIQNAVYRGEKMEIKIKREDKEVELPQNVHEGDAGFDLRSAEEKTIKPGTKEVIKTGLKMAIPPGYVGLIWDRSGLAAKNSMHVLAGVIDSSYRGVVGVVLQNLSEEDFHVEKNMRIAQMLIQKHETVDFVESEELDESDRGENGFGSSGN